MIEEVEDKTSLADVMRELRQLRLAVQELTRIVQRLQQAQPMPNDGRQLLRDLTPWS